MYACAPYMVLCVASILYKIVIMCVNVCFWQNSALINECTQSVNYWRIVLFRRNIANLLFLLILLWYCIRGAFIPGDEIQKKEMNKYEMCIAIIGRQTIAEWWKVLTICFCHLLHCQAFFPLLLVVSIDRQRVPPNPNLHPPNTISNKTHGKHLFNSIARHHHAHICSDKCENCALHTWALIRIFKCDLFHLFRWWNYMSIACNCLYPINAAFNSWIMNTQSKKNAKIFYDNCSWLPCLGWIVVVLHETEEKKCNKTCFVCVHNASKWLTTTRDRTPKV